MTADPRSAAVLTLATLQVTADEGFRDVPYLDTLGRLTWGYGDTAHGVAPGRRCTIKQACGWRDDYLAGLMAGLNTAIPWWTSLTVGRRAALLDMAYQLGLRGLLNFARMLAALHTGDYATAASEALDSRWAQQTPARAQRIAKALHGPEIAPSGRVAQVAA